MRSILKSATGWLRARWQSLLPRERTLLFLLLLLPLVFALSACTRSIVFTPDALRCSDFVPSEMWAKTPGADLPATDAIGSWVGFGNAQTGQLEIANSKPPSIQHIITTCEAKLAAAIEKANRESRPWWKLF